MRDFIEDLMRGRKVKRIRVTEMELDDDGGKTVVIVEVCEADQWFRIDGVEHPATDSIVAVLSHVSHEWRAFTSITGITNTTQQIKPFRQPPLGAVVEIDDSSPRRVRLADGVEIRKVEK